LYVFYQYNRKAIHVNFLSTRSFSFSHKEETRVAGLDPEGSGRIRVIFESWIRIRISVKSWIRIRIKVKGQSESLEAQNRAKDAHNGGLEDQNGALEGL
jgi:hypothetical protein